MAPEFPELPVRAEVKVGYEKVEEKKVYDYKNFPPCTNKIEDVGTLRKRKFLVKCDGRGGMKFDELKNPLQTIEELGKLKDKGYITEEEFLQKKKEILKKI